MKKNLLACMALLLVVLNGCNHKELCYHHPHTARVRINVDWSEFDRETPTGMTVKVYSVDGSAPITSVGHTLDHATFDLGAGLYNTLTFNQSVSEFGSVSFRDMDNFHAASVVTNAITSRWYKGRSEGEVVVTNPEWLASGSDTDNRVTEEMVEHTRHEQSQNVAQQSLTEHLLTTHVPQNLIYTVYVKVRIAGIHNLRSARGALDGWAQSVKLASRQPDNNKVTHLLENWSLKLDSTDVTKGYIKASFNCLGFPFGHQELPEDNKFMLSLLLVDNKTQLDRIFHVGDKFIVDPEDDHILYLILDWGDGLPDDDPDPDPEPDPDPDPDPDPNPDPDPDPDPEPDPKPEPDPEDPLPDVKPEGGSASGFDAIVLPWGDEMDYDIIMKDLNKHIINSKKNKK